ncbi:MAG: hypothetical protein WCE87_14200 [Candidatus Udaeobacter sp.]
MTGSSFAVLPFLGTRANRSACYIRPQRLFTLGHHIILYPLGKVTEAKLVEVLKRAREFFID